MSKSSNINIIRFIALYIFLPAVLVKLLWSISLFFLEKGSVDEQKKVDYIYHYNVNFAKQMLPTSQIKVKPKPIKKVEEPAAKLNSIKLKATYVDDPVSFMVVMNGKEIEFVYVNEKYKGYTVKRVESNRVVLEKKGETFYILIDDKDDKKKASTSKRNPYKRAGLVGSKSPKRVNPGASEASVPDEPTVITKAEMNEYIKNPNKIWRAIRIQEIRKSGQIDGFRINYVKRGSFFAKGGLRAGDVIKSIDGKEIKSLSDVMKYYSNIDTLEGLSLGVKRGQDEIDLEFSITE